MKKIVGLLIGIIGLWLVAVCPAGDFREADWGMSMAEVKKAEKAAEYHDGSAEMLVYKGKLLGRFPVAILYNFSDGKLSRGTYLIEEPHSNPQLYIDDYEQIKKSLVQKYGKPVTEKTVRNGDLWGDPGEEGIAVTHGYLIYFTQWVIERTKISLTLKGDRGQITLGVSYQDANKQTVTSTEGL